MFSRLALRATTGLSKSSILYRTNASAVATAPKAASPTTSTVRKYPHDHADRDFVNFPAPVINETSGKVRMGFIPDEWFQSLYPRTGVTGPYILFWGSIATILSKEYYPYWVDTTQHTVLLMLTIGTAVYGGPVAAKMINEWLAEDIAKEKEAEKAAFVGIDKDVATAESTRVLPEVNKIVSAAKKENVLLQLEAAYRQRLAQINQEVKKRLDYQVAVQSAFKRLERDQALNYIFSEVNKALGPAQEKEAFQAGLNHLKSLSKKHAGSI